MTYYIRAGARFNVADKNALNLQENLPVGTYTVGWDEMNSRFFLSMVANLEISGKVYGDTNKVTERIFTTFMDRPASTGVMLAGEKGSGKTLQAKKLSHIGLQNNIPTIIINQPWHGELFNQFMQTIDQPTIILFDEFEKTYDEQKSQEALLTLFDGVYPSKKMFVITCNDSYRINQHLKNRPGRIYYRKDYKGLEREFIEEYCRDNLKNQANMEGVCKIAVAFSEFNFDILKAMVEEMNRYDETAQETMSFLNARPEFSNMADYEGFILSEDKKIAVTWRGAPLNGNPIRIYFTAPGAAKDWEDSLLGLDEDGDGSAEFLVSDLVKVDAQTGSFLFVNSEKVELHLTKKVEKTYNYNAF